MKESTQVICEVSLMKQDTINTGGGGEGQGGLTKTMNSFYFGS